jgi:hypothetical protein
MRPAGGRGLATTRSRTTRPWPALRRLGEVGMQDWRRAGILIKGPSLKLLDPGSDQVARDVVAFGETVECLARMKSWATCRLNSMLWVARSRVCRRTSSGEAAVPVSAAPVATAGYDPSTSADHPEPPPLNNTHTTYIDAEGRSSGRRSRRRGVASLIRTLAKSE